MQEPDTSGVPAGFPRRTKRILLTLAGICVCWLALWYWAHREDLEHDGFAFVWRSQYFAVGGDGCGLLDKTLGASARVPGELLKVLDWRYDRDSAKNPYGLGHPAFFDVQHQALVRLLALQRKEFRVEVPPQRTPTLQMDHSGARVDERVHGIITVSGSASVYPDWFDAHPWEGYFFWETFTFDESGKLLIRAPYSGK